MSRLLDGGEPPRALGFTWEASNMSGVRLHVTFTVDDLGDGRSRVGVVHKEISMTIEIRRTLAATPERVFHALTDADDLSHWWTTTAESEPRTGGSFSYGFEFEDATRDHTYTGTYHDVTPAESVSYPWQTGLGETTVDVSVRPAGAGTELTLVHRGWGEGAEWDEAVSMHEQGWGFFLDNLVACLDRGEDLRPSAPMGQKMQRLTQQA